MIKLKVLTIVGTRPEIIRLSRIFSCFDRYFHHVMVHTGQNYDYELNEIFYKELLLRSPDYLLQCGDGSSSASKVIGGMIISIDAVLDIEKPDAVLVLGDTNSCLTVIAAKKRKIPIFHMEAGNRCFDDNVPEEVNRKIIDHLADINLAYSAIARQHLISEGINSSNVIVTGSPMREVLNYYHEKICQSNILEKLNLTAGNYFVVSVHREENVERTDKFLNFIHMLSVISEKYKIPVIVSTHPRTAKKIYESNVVLPEAVKLMKPFGFFEYVKLQKCSRATLSDSGTISEESSILKFPALNLRESHERPEAMEAAAVMMVGLEVDRIVQGLEILANESNSSDGVILSQAEIVKDYQYEHVSLKVHRIIISYINSIRRKRQ